MNPSVPLPYVPVTLKSHDYKPGFQFKPLLLHTRALLFVTGGSGHWEYKGASFRLAPGICLNIPTATPARLLADSHLTLEYVSYVPAYPLGQITTAAEENVQHCELESSAAVSTLLARLREALSGTKPSHHYRKLAAFYELLALVEEHLQAQAAAEAEIKHHTLHRAVQYMKDHFADAIQIADLAKMSGLTPSSFSRSFRMHHGMAPLAYLTELRIEHAKRLMADNSLPLKLKDISERIGFQDDLYFSKVFKKREGVSPTIYMRRNQRKVAVISGLNLQDQLLSLGIRPIAAPGFPAFYKNSSGFPVYLQHELRATASINAERSVSLDEVTRLEPDLILKAPFMGNPNSNKWLHESGTIFLPSRDNWKQYLFDIADHLHKTAEAERVVAHVKHAELCGRKALAPVQRRGTWVIVRLLPGDCRLYGSQGHALAHLFFHRLGFQPDDRVHHASYRSHALETLVHLDPERILLIWSESEVVARFMCDPLWRQLRAVRENRVYCPDSKHWDPWGPIGRVYMIRALSDYFLSRAPY